MAAWLLIDNTAMAADLFAGVITGIVPLFSLTFFPSYAAESIVWNSYIVQPLFRLKLTRVDNCCH